MADFATLRYNNYLRLCQELRLARSPREGDWWGRGKEFVIVFCWPDNSADPEPYEFWLPSLADWLEKLREAGWWRGFTLDPLAGGDYRVVATGPPTIEGPSGNSEMVYPRRSGEGPTYEEAAARLWMAVTGHQPPPT